MDWFHSYIVQRRKIDVDVGNMLDQVLHKTYIIDSLRTPMCNGVSLIGIMVEAGFTTCIGVGSYFSPFHRLILIVVSFKVENEVEEVGESVKCAFSANGGHEGIHEDGRVGDQFFLGHGCNVHERMCVGGGVAVVVVTAFLLAFRSTRVGDGSCSLCSIR